MAVEFRAIRVGDIVMRTFGVVDLCVADDDRLYARNGWARVTNRCS